VLFVIGNRLREVRFDSEKLSSEQWAKITDLTGFPEKAKSELEDYIGFYRTLRDDARQQYRDVSRRVERVRQWEAEALRGLTKLISSGDFIPALAMGIEHQVKIFDEELDLIREWLEQACEKKRKLLDWYDKALARLRRSKRVPSSLFNLIHLLNTLLEKYAERRISSGKKDPAFTYVLEVCRIAEPTLKTKKDNGLGTIQEITKRVVTEIISNEWMFDIEAWGELIPYWKPTNSISIRDTTHKIEVEYHQDGDVLRGETRVPPEAIPVIILAPFFAPETGELNPPLHTADGSPKVEP
jgi:hypothetical protein